MGSVLALVTATGTATLAQGAQPAGSPCTVAADCASNACSPDGLCVDVGAGAGHPGQAPSAVEASSTRELPEIPPDTDGASSASRAVPVTQGEVGTMMSILTFLKQGGLLAVVIVLTLIIGALAREYAKARDVQMETLTKTRDEEKATLNALTQVLVQSATVQTQVSESLENLSETIKALDENQRASAAKILRALDRLAIRMEGRKIVNQDEFDEETPEPKA